MRFTRVCIPPYSYSDAAIQKAVGLLGRDALIEDKVQHHDRSFGYNTAQGYVEEDSVQALEEIVSEEVGAGQNPCQYWKQQDGGMHVLAAAIYVDYKEALARHPEPYPRWFEHAVTSGQLRGRELKATVEAFFSAISCGSVSAMPH